MHPDSPTAGIPRQTTAREFLSIVFRRKAVILGLLLVTTTTVLLISLLTPTTYLSSGRVLIKRGEKESSLSTSRRSAGDWEEEMGSEMETVKSGAVIDRARALLAAEAGPGRTPPAFEPGDIDVEVIGRTNVIGIGYVSRDPVTARQVCDALIRAYVEYRQNDFSLSVPRDFFEDEIGQVQRDLDYWTQRRKNFAENAEVVDLQMQRNADIGRMSSLQERRNQTEADLAEAEMGAQKLSELGEGTNLDQPSFALLFGNETALMELKRRVVDQEFHVASLRERLREDAPDLVASSTTLDTLRAMMRREIESRVGASRARVDVLKARLQVVNRDIADLAQSLGDMPGKERSLSEMDNRISVLKDRLREVTAKGDMARITENTSPARNAVLLAGASAARPRNARDYVRLALAPAFSVVVGIGVAFFLDGLDLTVRTARQAEEAVELPVLASLNERRRRSRRKSELAPEGATG
jgi:polysaccharide biosynthesis transport protein